MRAETVTEAAADAVEREEEADLAARTTVTRMEAEAVAVTDPEVAEEVATEVEEDSEVAAMEAEAALDTEEEAAVEVGAVLPAPEAAEEAATMGAVDRMIGGEKREGWQQCAVLLRILFPLQYRYHHLLA